MQVVRIVGSANICSACNRRAPPATPTGSDLHITLRSSYTVYLRSVLCFTPNIIFLIRNSYRFGYLLYVCTINFTQRPSTHTMWLSCGNKRMSITIREPILSLILYCTSRVFESGDDRGVTVALGAKWSSQMIMQITNFFVFRFRFAHARLLSSCSIGKG